MTNPATQYFNQYFSTLWTGQTAYQVQEASSQPQAALALPVAPHEVAAKVESLRASFEESAEPYRVSEDVMEKLARDTLTLGEIPICITHASTKSPDARCVNQYDPFGLRGLEHCPTNCNAHGRTQSDKTCHQIAYALLKSRLEGRPWVSAVTEVRFPATHRKYYSISKDSVNYFLPAYPGDGVELVSQSQAEREGIQTPNIGEEYSLEIQKKSRFIPGTRDVTRTFYVISDTDSAAIKAYEEASLNLLEGALAGEDASLDVQPDIGPCTPAEAAALKTRQLAKIIVGFAVATLTCLGALYCGLSTLTLLRALVVTCLGEGALTFAYNAYWVAASCVSFFLIAMISHDSRISAHDIDFFPRLIEGIGQLSVWIIQKMADLTLFAATNLFGAMLTIPAGWSLAGRATLTMLYASPILVGIVGLILFINETPLTAVYDYTVGALPSAPRVARMIDRAIYRYL